MTNMNKINRKIKALVLIASLIIIASISVIFISGKIQRTSVRGEIEVSTKELTATTTYTSSADSFSWTYTKAGDVKTINVATTNSSDAVLHNTYYITAANINNDLYKAILVYYNDEFVGPLNKLISENTKIDELYNYIPLSVSKTDTFKFELHQSAKDAQLDKKTISITLNTYTENADYSNYMYVHNETEFKKAVDDVNSGLLEDPSIIFCNSITLASSYTIANPVTLYTDSYTVSGSITLNDNEVTSPDALIKAYGDTLSNLTITLGSYYDEASAKQLQIDYAKAKLENGVNSNSQTNIVGPYSFYNITIGNAYNCSYTAPNVIIANTVNEYYTRISTIKVDNEVIKFKAYGSKTALLADTLAHMPAATDTITTDLFLPTFIPGENSSIRWSSSNTSIMSNDGKIAATRIENETITLYAEIKINNKTYTETFTFKISAHTNEINFYKLVQEISPIVINNIYNDASDADDALYFLPIVNNYSDYDYRVAYKTPTNTEKFDWQGYIDIGLENITYSMTTEQADAYPYITCADPNLGGNTLYLNATTMNNYATITITGDFGNNETYSTDIKISIAVGADTQLLEKVFSKISDDLDEISILGNILETRLADGMSLEKGDFELDSQFYDDLGNVDTNYVIEFSKQTSVNIIDSITYDSSTKIYTFTINPEYFKEYETSVPFIATVYYKRGTENELSKSRTFYVTAPAALHITDFGTISIYNSLKYQTYTALPSGEKDGASGYAISGSVLTDSNLDYVLLRDIVGDELYLTEYNANSIYLDQIEYTSSNYAPGVTNVTLAVNPTNNTSATDTKAYDFVKLIEWATNDKKVTASSVVRDENAVALGGYASVKSNGKDYLNDNEIGALKAYYQYYTGASDADWELIYAEILDRAPGYIFTEVKLLNTVLACLKAEISSFAPGNFSTMFGKYMEILQRYAVSTTTVNANNVAPCQEQYNNMNVCWYHSKTYASSFTLYDSNDTAYTCTTNSSSIQIHDGSYWLCATNPNPGSGGDGGLAGLYATKYYAADLTSYITDAEIAVLQIFLINCLNASGRTTTFSDAQKNSINAVLNNAAYAEFYEGYSFDDDFKTCGKAVLNAFLACTEVPTYFSTDGVSKLISYFYTNYNYNNSPYKLKLYDGTSTSTFSSILNSNVPYVTNLDNLKNTLSYFINLETLVIKGNPNVSAFLSENGLAVVFARASLNNKKINRLEMNYCANKYTNFDLSNIANYNMLTYLDLSNNQGIQSVNELVNVNRSKYTHVDIQNIGIELEYQEFAIDNIASTNCPVYYTNDSGEAKVSTDSSRATKLSDLEDFNKFITKYMYMTNVVYNDDGTTSTVTWRIDEGNEIQSGLVEYAGQYYEINTIEEMNQFVSPYYYATENFTYDSKTFVKNTLYKITFNNGMVATSIGTYNSINDLSDATLANYVDNDISTVVDTSTYTPDPNITYLTKDITTAGTVTYSDLVVWNEGSTTSITKTCSYNFYTNTSTIQDSGPSSITLPTEDELKTYITNQYGSFTNLAITSISIIVTSKNRNTSPGGNNDWPHGIFIGNYYSNGYGIIEYSKNTNSTKNSYCVPGASTYTFEALTDKNYLGQKLYLCYDNNRKPRNNPDWRIHNRQAIETIDITITYSYSVSSNIYVSYKNGTDLSLDSYYACGIRTRKSTATTIIYTEHESTIFDSTYGNDSYLLYTGSNTILQDEDGNDITIKNNTLLVVYPKFIYPVNSRERTYRIQGEVYMLEFWYINSQYDYPGFNTTDYQWYKPEEKDGVEAGTIDGDLISYVTVNNSTTYDFDTLLATLNTNHPSTTTTTYLVWNETTSQYDEVSQANWNDWSTTLTSSWQYDRAYCSPYVSYVTNISSTNHTFYDNQKTIYTTINGSNRIYKYTGSTASEYVYEESTWGNETSYTHNYLYNLYLDNGRLAWYEYSTDATVGSTNMDAILATANSHFKDNQYGYYYGRYYGYSGETIYTSTGNYYEQGYVYRIMPNENNSAFVWEKIQLYKTNSNAGLLQDLGIGIAEVGDFYYTTGNNGFDKFFTSGWYKIIIDEKTNIVNLVKYNDIGFTAGTNYTKLTNDKMVAREGDYLGYSGTFTVQISAMIRTFNADGTVTDYIKTYKLRFVGSLYKPSSGGTPYN